MTFPMVCVCKFRSPHGRPFLWPGRPGIGDKKLPNHIVSCPILETDHPDNAIMPRVQQVVGG